MTINDAKLHFSKTIEFFRQELAKMRTGRATPSIVEDVLVEYYGTKTPLKNVASITVPEPNQLLVEAWDASVIPNIDKALKQSDLGSSPAVEGQRIRVRLPSLTEERRQEIVKIAKQKGETARIAIRSTREECLKELKRLEHDGVSEDVTKQHLDELQDEVKKATEAIDDILKKKQEEILTL